MNPFDPEDWNRQRDLQALDALEADARIDGVSRMTASTDSQPLTADEREIAIDNAARFLKSHPEITRGKLARMAGVGPSTLSELLRRKYKGEPDPIITKIEAAVSEWYRRKEAPSKGAFVRTRVAKRIFSVIKGVAKASSMGALYAPSGVGKTMTLEAALQVDFPSGILIKVDPRCTSPYNFCLELLRQAARPRGVPHTVRNQADAFGEIVRRLRDSQRLILIDEADALQIETFNTVRQIHDATGCPIVLAGRPNLAGKIDRTTRHAEIGGSFRGRLIFEYDLMAELTGAGSDHWLFSVDEVAQILATYKVAVTRDAAEWLTMLANVSVCDGNREAGGLRYATKVFTLAMIIAQRKGVRSVSRELIEAANQNTRDRTYADEIARRIDELIRRPATRAAASG